MDYQLVIQFPIREATAEDFDRLIMIENELGIILGKQHNVDCHDLGSGEMNIFIHTNDPNKAFGLAKNVLSDKELNTISAAYRKTEDEKYSVIWPENFNGEFRIR